MKKSKFSPNQIVKILGEYDKGKTAVEVCREHGISQATLYNWKKRYGGMEASDLKRLKALEEENTKLKRMYAELALDHQMAKEIIENLPDGRQESFKALPEATDCTRATSVRYKQGVPGNASES